MLAFERPIALVALLLVVPSLAFLAARLRALMRACSLLSADAQTRALITRIRRKLIAKFTFRALSWCALTLALSGISWGTRLQPVQKSGDAVCLVFDISYSMCATDVAPEASELNTLSRLDAARLYASELLSALRGTSVALVLAKGDGVLALPLTEDYATLTALLEELSPRLLSAAGSSIGKGIRTALDAFPANSAQASHIWVFTDGDETDDGLAPALEEAIRYGIPVTLIGFGSERGADITAGDGKTTVHTALQEKKLQLAAEQANKKAISRRQQQVRYESALSTGAAYRLLQELSQKPAALPEATSAAAVTVESATAEKQEALSNSVYAYELQPIERYKSFMLLALVFFVLSFVAGEFSFAYVRLKPTAALLVFTTLSALTLTSCSHTAAQRLKIAEASWQWYQKSYPQAAARFLQVCSAAEASENSLLCDYARFGLSATYLMQEEYEAAAAKLTQLDVQAPECTPQLKSAAYYNQGIIAHQQGDYERASELFKLSILADDANLSAKINLELTEYQRKVSNAQAGEAEVRPVAESKEDSTLETGIFNLIKENEQNQWKRLQASPASSDVIDY